TRDGFGRPDLLLEARIGTNRYTTFRTPRSYGYDFTDLGLPASLKQQVEYLLFPRFTPTGISAIGTVQNDLIRQANESWSAGAALTKIRGGHVIKFGWEQRLYRYNNSQSGPVLDFGFAPTFTRGPDPNVASATAGYGFATFLLGTPTAGSSARSRPVTDSLQSTGLFLQDDWKVTPKLTLNLGLRWEFEGAIKDRFNVMSNFDPGLETKVGDINLRGGLIYPGVNGVSRGHRDNSWNDFGPRFGFAYQVMPKTVLRGGFGLFYLPTHGTFVRLGTTGFSIATNMITSVDGGFTPYETLSNPFTQGIQSPPGSSLGALTGLGTGVAGNMRGIRSGYSEQWNFNVQRDLPGRWLLEVAYLGNHGVSLPANQVYGFLPDQYLSLGTQLQDMVPNPYAGLIQVGTLSQPKVTRAALLRNFPQFSGASGLGSWADSIYHAMTVRLEKRMSRGLSMLLAYTYSKLIDDNLGNGANDNFFEGGSNAVQNWNNLRPERAISTSDVPQRLVISPSWELPLARAGNRYYRALAGGWQIHSIFTMQSGDPMAITAQAPAFGGNRPNVVGDPNLPNPTIDRWFNTGAFAVISPFTYGNAPRNLPRTRTDGLFNWDLAAMKNFTIRERARVQFRAEFFNFTNTPTFGAPGQVLTNPAFGVVSAVSNGARRLQFALKIYF
ncbi:MAG: TonB-dependent receptor, partial [Acidobacteria bacterium]|nr:TonB-dependent receptor [Acidobacteriota bacterium]